MEVQSYQTACKNEEAHSIRNNRGRRLLVVYKRWTNFNVAHKRGHGSAML